MSSENTSTANLENISTSGWDENTPLSNFPNDPSTLTISFYSSTNGNREYMTVNLRDQESMMSDAEEEEEEYDGDPLFEQISDSSEGFVLDSVLRSSGQQVPVLALPNYYSFTISGGLFTEDDGALRMAENLSADEEPKAKPASKESIENLENVLIGDQEDSYCSVCLDVIPVGSEAKRMPCLHVYHNNCIVDWLMNSNTCPLCRHQMPTAHELLDFDC